MAFLNTAPVFSKGLCCTICHSKLAPSLSSLLTASHYQPRSPHLIQKRNASQSFADKYLSTDFAPIGYAQNLLETIHDSTGLPWWASIAITTFTLRTFITLPLAVYSTHVMTRVELLQPEIQQLQKELKGEVAMATKQHGWDNKLANFHFRKNMKRHVKELYIRENCHPFKASIVAWVQLPMWVSTSFALRNMAGSLPMRGTDLPVLCPDLSAEGILWFSNLLLPDTTWILPVSMALMNLAINEMHALKTEKQQGLSRGITIFMRGLCVVMIPIAASVPSCMAWYWTCSSFYGMSQNIAMRFPTVRRALRIQPTPSESQTPFKDMWKNAKKKYSRKKKVEDE